MIYENNFSKSEIHENAQTSVSKKMKKTYAEGKTKKKAMQKKNAFF